MDVEGVCRRLFGPRRRLSVEIDNYMRRGVAVLTQDRDRARERERERLHVRGEARPLLHLKPQTNDEDTSVMDALLLHPTNTVRIVVLCGCG